MPATVGRAGDPLDDFVDFVTLYRPNTPLNDKNPYVIRVSGRSPGG